MRTKLVSLAIALLLVALIAPSTAFQTAAADSGETEYHDVFGPGDEQWGYPYVFTMLPNGQFLLGTLAPSGTIRSESEYSLDGSFESSQTVTGFTGAIYAGPFPDTSRPLYLFSNSRGKVEVSYPAGTLLVPYKGFLAPSPFAVPDSLKMKTFYNEIPGMPRTLKFRAH